jgi:hypothetical protein
MKLPPRLARWFDALRRAHERQEEEHLRAMAKANTWKGPGRRLRMPPPSPPGGRNTGGRSTGGGYTGGRNTSGRNTSGRNTGGGYTGGRNSGGRYKGR